VSQSEITGIDELIANLKLIENLPQTMVTKAAKQGANIALKNAKSNLQPVKGTFLGRQGKTEQHQGGDLKNALKLKAERSPKKGRQVYQITTTWYAHFKDLYFTTRNGEKIEGSHFLKNALSEHYDEIVTSVVEQLSKGVMEAVSKL
jgi:HK97 gp10 family phage protein